MVSRAEAWRWASLGRRPGVGVTGWRSFFRLGGSQLGRPMVEIEAVYVYPPAAVVEQTDRPVSGAKERRPGESRATRGEEGQVFR